MKILVPTDFSNPCKKAIKFATYLATALKAEMVIFHAVPLYSIWLEHEESKVLAAAEKKLAAIAASISRETGGKIRSNTFVVHRFPLNDVIEEITTKMKIDFIVMGTKGVTAATNKMIGGFASGMIRHSTTPVIAVPVNNNKKTISNIVLPTDLINMADEIKTVVKFAKWFNATIHVLFVPKKGNHESLPANARKLTTYKNIHFHEVSGKDPEVIIEKFIKDHNADLLAMFTRKRRFFARLFDPGLTESLSYDISIPLLAFKKE